MRMPLTAGPGLQPRCSRCFRFRCCSAVASCSAGPHRRHWLFIQADSTLAACYLVQIRFPLHAGGSPVLWRHLFWFRASGGLHLHSSGMGAASHILRDLS
jgi:hypothetical protein